MEAPLPASLTAYQPTAAERESYDSLFAKADTESIGVITGDLAVPFFQHARLPPALLGEVWQLSDPDNDGFLTRARFGVACRLIGHAQAAGPGRHAIDPSWVGKSGPLANFSNYPLPSHLASSQAPLPSAAAAAAPVAPASPVPSRAPKAAPAAPAAGTTISADEKQRYAKLFANSGPVLGLLDGDKARDIFLKSRLPLETLGQIWNLADTRSRGSLDVADFTIAMHLIQHTMNGSLPSVPTSLPPALYASAAGLPPPAAAPISPVPTGGFPQMPGSPLRQQLTGTGARPLAPQLTGGYGSPIRQPTLPPQQLQQQPWDVTPAAKAQSDVWFDGLDTQHRGVIEGDVAVPFFMASQLPEATLASVWDLADIKGQGKLGKDEFAVAMKLIMDAKNGVPLPATLPTSMVPPSLRAQGPPQPQGPTQDLLSLMDDDPPPAVSAPLTLSPQATGGSAFSGQGLRGTIFPQATGGSGFSQATAIATPRSPPPPVPHLQPQQQYIPPQSTILSPQATGVLPAAGLGAAAGLGVGAAAVAASTNFFDDNDDQDKASELAAEKVKHATLTKDLASVTSGAEATTAKRGEVEAELAKTTAAINELHTKISQARAAHDTEKTMMEDLERRHTEQKDLLARAKHELIAAESDLSALRMERTEAEGNYLRDKEEVRELQKKMKDVALQTGTLKETLEKVKKEARQTKGMVAIAKKQLSTAEGEREKVETELKEEESKPKGVPAAEEEDSPFDHVPTLAAPSAVAASLPLPITPAAASPAASITSNRSNNPFDRMGSIGSSFATSPVATGKAPEAPADHGFGAGGLLAAGAAGAAVIGGGSLLAKELASSPIESPAAAAAVEDTDPFGVPVSPPTQQANTFASTGFDDGFGDDFASAAPPVAAAAATTSFDDAFGDFPEEPAPAAVDDAPVETPFVDTPFDAPIEPEPVAPILKDEDELVAAPIEETFAAPVEEPILEAVEEPVPAAAEEPLAAPVVEAPVTDVLEEEPTPFSELDSKTLSAADDIPDTPKEVEHEVQAEPLAAAEPEAAPAAVSAPVEDEVDDEDEDSSDDEPEVEDATATYGHGARAESGGSPVLATSDSGSSYVHVPPVTAADSSITSSTLLAEEPVIETEEATTIPGALPGLDGSATADEPETSEDDFEDTVQSEASEAPVVPEPVVEAAPAPTLAPEALAAVPIAAAVAAPTKKRAAPPPPPGRGLSTGHTSTSSTPLSQVPAVQGFDDSFDSPFDAPSDPVSASRTPNPPVAGSTVPVPTSAKDDFDDAFDDLPPPSEVTPGGDGATPQAFDSFDDEFTFKSDFDSTAAKGAPSNDFDESFADFDSAFEPAQAAPAGQAAASSSAFDDAFGDPAFDEPPAPAPALEVPAPPVPAPPIPSPAIPGDPPGVQEITAMGFSRSEAMKALMKYDNNVQRALNGLLG